MKYLEVAKELQDALNGGGLALMSRVRPKLNIGDMGENNYLENGIAFILYEEATQNDGNTEIIGHIVLAEPKKNLLISEDGESELIIAEIFVSENYKGEGIEALLLEIAIDYSLSLRRPLLIHEVVFKKQQLSTRFFESRGFISEPIIYHEVVLVMGFDYIYNLKNIERECVEHLDISKLPEGNKENKVNKEIFVETIENIIEIKKIANNIDYLPTFLEELGAPKSLNKITKLHLPEVPSLKKVESIKGLNEATIHYLNTLETLNLLTKKIGINSYEREDVYFNELPFLVAEPFIEKLSDILESENVSDNYLLSIYDLNEMTVPIGENRKLAEEIAGALAPCDLFELSNKFGTKSLKHLGSF